MTTMTETRMMESWGRRPRIRWQSRWIPFFLGLAAAALGALAAWNHAAHAAGASSGPETNCDSAVKGYLAMDRGFRFMTFSGMRYPVDVERGTARFKQVAQVLEQSMKSKSALQVTIAGGRAVDVRLAPSCRVGTALLAPTPMKGRQQAGRVAVRKAKSAPRAARKVSLTAPASAAHPLFKKLAFVGRPSPEAKAPKRSRASAEPAPFSSWATD